MRASVGCDYALLYVWKRKHNNVSFSDACFEKTTRNLVDFFEKHREEVVEVSIYDYDEEEVRMVVARDIIAVVVTSLFLYARMKLYNEVCISAISKLYLIEHLSSISVYCLSKRHFTPKYSHIKRFVF